jgi:hypothetical protein
MRHRGIEVLTSEFEFSHSSLPRGRGGWWFRPRRNGTGFTRTQTDIREVGHPYSCSVARIFDHDGHLCITVSGLYSQARKAACYVASIIGADDIMVLP